MRNPTSNAPGAGMSMPLHYHAKRSANLAASIGGNYQGAYARAAGTWCPNCNSSKERIEDNGLDHRDPTYGYRCTACDHQWSPNEA